MDPFLSSQSEVQRLEVVIAERAAEGNIGAAAALHFRAAQICLTEGEGARDRGLEHLWTSWRLQPENLDARLVLLHCLERDGRLEDLAEVCRRSAERVEDALEQVTLLCRAAELLEQVGERTEAFNILRGLALTGGQRLRHHRLRAIRSLALALEQAGELAEAVNTLELLLRELQGDERFSCAIHRAALQLQLGDRDGAHQSYLDALLVHPAAPVALEPVLRYLEEHERHDDFAAILTAAAHAARQPAERASVLRRLGELYEEQLGDPAHAAELWWEAWQERAVGGEAARCKRLYAKMEAWDRYQAVLRREAGNARSTEAKAEVYRELAIFQREVLHAPLEAAKTYGQILQLHPDDEVALSARLAIFDEARLEEAAAAALRRYADRATDPHTRDGLIRRLARLELRKPRRGQLMRLLQQLDLTTQESFDHLRELQQQLSVERDQDLHIEIGMLVLKLARERGDANCAAMAMALAVQCEAVGELGRASDCYRQVLELEPEHGEARARLVGTAHASEARLADPTPTDLAARAESLTEGNPTRAVRLLLQAAQVESTRAEVDAERIGAYLRRAQELCPPDAAETQLLEEALRSAGLHQELVALLRREAEREEMPAKRKSILRYLAQLYAEQLDDPAHAAEMLEEVLSLDPKDGEAAEQIRRLYRKLQNHAALAHVLEEQLARVDGRSRVPLLEELGRLHSGELQDSAAALNRYGELLSLVPDHAEALRFCRTHDEKAGDYRSVALLLCRAAEAAGDLLARAELHREIAEIAEQRLQDADFAIAQWIRVVDLCPADSAPRAELRRLLASTGRWREVEAALLAEVSRSLRPEEKVPIYHELAALAQAQLHDDHAAASYLRLAQQLSPGSREILAQLEQVYERLGMWRELATVLRRHADLEGEIEEKLKLLHRAARVLLARLKRDEEALAVCRYVRELRPGDRVTATLMGEIFTKRGQWRERLALLREQIAHETDPLDLGRLHLELGHMLIDRLGDAEEAAGHFEQALELDGGRGEVLPLLRRLYESQGRWDQLVDLIRRRAAAETVSVQERAAALCEIGRIREVHQNDLDGAWEAYERASHLDATYLPALTALRAVALRRAQWRELVTLGRRALQITEDPAERARTLLEIAQILQEKMSRPSAAAEALEEALTCEPGNLQAAQRLAGIYFDSEEWEKAGQLLEKVLDSGLDLGNLHEYYYRIGFATERLGREDDAFSFYVKSFGREPMYLPTLDRLVELCYTRRQWDNTLRIAEAIVTTYEDQKSAAELAELYLRIGLCELHLAQRDVAIGKLQDMVLEAGESPSTPAESWVDAAESWAATALEQQLLPLVGPDVFGRVVRAMERSLMHAADHPGPLQVLSAISMAIGDWERALRYLERCAESPQVERKQRVRLLVCAGDVAAQRLLSSQRAETYYRRAQAVLPGSSLVRQRLETLQVTPTFAPRPPVPPPPPEGTVRASPPPLPAPRFRPTQTQPLPGRVVTPQARPESAGSGEKIARPPPVPAPQRVPTPRSKPRKDE